nr:hypothetical protein GCM10020185_75530 [Pseudomonas brassicacearum subsp. brassicacearum]
MRERTAHAVLRLLGGQKLDAAEVGEEIADMLEGDEPEQVFHRRERVMISGVLQLAERPIRSVMTPRAQIDHLDLADAPQENPYGADALFLLTLAVDPGRTRG